MVTDKKKLIKEALSVVIRASLAATFIFACIHKILDPGGFALQVATYQILPLGLINLQAIALPFVELVAALALIVGFWTRPAALVTIGMNIMFIAAIAMALHADLHLQCGCFAAPGAGEEMSVDLIYRDALFIVLAGVLIFIGPDRYSIDAVLEKRSRTHASA